jgi:hypothetical protein
MPADLASANVPPWWDERAYLTLSGEGCPTLCAQRGGVGSRLS